MNNVNTDRYVQGIDAVLDSLYVLNVDLLEEPDWIVPRAVRERISLYMDGLEETLDNLKSGFFTNSDCYFCNLRHLTMRLEPVACRLDTKRLFRVLVCDNCYWTVYRPAYERVNDAT